MVSSAIHSDGGGIDRDDLLRRVELDDVLDHLSGPAVAGRWRCPDASHPDEHPSVTVRAGHDGIQRWRCWSGGHRGTAIDAVVAAHRVAVGEAIRWLADRYENASVYTRPAPAAPPPVGPPGPAVVEYVERAQRLLWTPAGEPQRQWLAARGLDDEVLRINRVGADPGRRFLPRPRGFPPGWPAVIYPALDRDGRVVYFQARYLDPLEHRSKYDNPAGHHAANPRLAWTIPLNPQEPGLLVVCEGIPDALIASQAGFHAVGVLGSTYSDTRVADGVADVYNSTQHGRFGMVVICFDADDAGHTGAMRLCSLLLERAVRVLTVAPPDGLDLTSWAQTDSGWVDAIAAPGPLSLPPPRPAPAVGLGLSLGGR
jgi:DNA primase